MSFLNPRIKKGILYRDHTAGNLHVVRFGRYLELRASRVFYLPYFTFDKNHGKKQEKYPDRYFYESSGELERNLCSEYLTRAIIIEENTKAETIELEEV